MKSSRFFKVDFVKRSFAHTKWGYSQCGFFLGLGNFLLLVYNFTSVKNYVDFTMFVPIFSIGLLFLFLFIGHFFRKKQMATESTLGFEHSPTLAKILRLILESIPKSNESSKQIEYLKNIEFQNMNNKDRGKMVEAENKNCEFCGADNLFYNEDEGVVICNSCKRCSS